MTAKILPSAEYLHECFSYDPETGVLTWKHRPRGHFPTQRARAIFNSRFPNKSAGYIAPRGYCKIHISPRNICAHRIIWKMQTGFDPQNTIDHANGKKSDNRWCNLRPATRTEQSHNRKLHKNNLFGLRGATQRGKRWYADITINGIRRFLGYFATPEEASAAYEAAARQHFGEFYREH